MQIDDNGITINSVSPEEYQGIKSFEYNARLNNPAGTYAVDGYTFMQYPQVLIYINLMSLMMGPQSQLSIKMKMVKN